MAFTEFIPFLIAKQERIQEAMPAAIIFVILTWKIAFKLSIT